MTVRVTQVFVEVLTTRGTALHGYADGAMDYDFTTYIGYGDSEYVLDVAIPFNSKVNSQYYLPDIKAWSNRFHSQMVFAGLRRQQTDFISSYLFDANTRRDSGTNSQYALNKAIVAAQGWSDALQALNAYEQLGGFADAGYSLEAAFAAINAAFVSVYGLESLTQQTGYATAEYAFNAFVPATGYSDVAYDLLARLGLEAEYGSQYVLDVLAALESQRESQYELAQAYKAVQGYADTLYQLQIFQQLDSAFLSAFSLEAYLSAEAFRQSSYTLNKTLEAVLGFADSDYVLNAYLPAMGFADGAYDISIYSALTGYSDATYQLLALLQAQGYTDSTHFLDVTDYVYTWIVNQNTGAPYRYENHDFHSFGKIGSDYLGAKADGIYLLDGDDDGGTPIDAIASTGRLDFSSNRAKRVLAAYLGVDSAGQINLTLRTDANKSIGPYQFRVTPTGQQVERVKFAKGLKSRYWEFDIENVLGSEMSIDEIQFDIVELMQRLKR